VNERGPKTPFRIHRLGGELLLMGAVWEHAGDVETCAIITTRAVGTMLPLHHRMPLIVRESDVDPWLKGSAEDASAILSQGVTDLEAYPVTQFVNAPKNDSEMCWDRDEAVA
jgi:putative SOS response-associated peptidase YedK